MLVMFHHHQNRDVLFHLSVRFIPSMTGAEVVDFVFFFPHIAHELS